MTTPSGQTQVSESSRTTNFASIESTTRYPLLNALGVVTGTCQVLGHARHSENEGNYLVIINPFDGPPFLVRTADRALDTDRALSWNVPTSPRENADNKYNIRLGRYRHYKGGIYLVLGTAVDVDDEDSEPLVVYVPLYTHDGHAIAIRPKAMFEGFVEVPSDWPEKLVEEFPNLAGPSEQRRFSFIPY